MLLSNREDAVIDDLSTAQKFKFMIHRNKGGWDAKSLETLASELERELKELMEALDHFKDAGHGKESVISECADMANYLAMIIEKVKKA